MAEDTNEAMKIVPTWKKVVAVIVDFIVSLFLFGYLIAAFTGGITENGFELNGAPAFIVFGLMGAYFYLGYKVWKWTLGRMITGIK